MAKLTSKLVKTLAKEWGATLVGIASVDRFEGAPPGHGPLDLMPKAKSVIVAGVRIPDSAVEWDEYHLKMTEMKTDLGIDTNMKLFFNLMGHYTEDMILNIISVKLANYIEINYGIRTLPTPDAANTGLGYANILPQMGFFSQRHAAVRAGLGEFGLSGLVITPQYGPRVRYVSVITEAELEPDPLLKEKVCMRGKCGINNEPACWSRCANKALSIPPGVDLDKVFIDIPVIFDRPKCIEFKDGKNVFGCTFPGTCMRMCPTGKRVTNG
jgi:epoxyqueuosine reductase